MTTKHRVEAADPGPAGRSRVQTHPGTVEAAHARALAGSAAQSRFVEVAAGQRLHVIEVGDGPSLVLLHGSGPTALQFLPLLGRLRSVRARAVDRPGFGLSDPSASQPVNREAAVATVTAILDSLGLGATALLGSSMGEPGRCGTRLRIPTAWSGSYCLEPRH